ncbi:hypothetical protein B9Z55_022514 [Caenorhabditis nigoni]|nr:hypothetical protein B9Z55_022514 [Caenorhabditis nigoni]
MDATNSDPPRVVAFRQKFTWTTAQRTRLGEVFQSSKFITQRMINELAAELGVSQMKVELYFRKKRYYETKKAEKERERMRKNKRNLSGPQNVLIPAIPAIPMGVANNGPPIAVNPTWGVAHYGAPMNWGNYPCEMATPPAMPSQNQTMLGFDPLGYGELYNAHVGFYNAPPHAPVAQSAMNWNRGFIGYQHGYQPPAYAGQVSDMGFRWVLTHSLKELRSGQQAMAMEKFKMVVEV